MRALLMGVATLAALSAEAGSYSVTPVTVELSADRKVADVVVQNRGSAKLTIEARTFAWKQSGDSDELSPTREVMAFPPIFALAPGESQVVRVGVRGALPTSEEAAYRLQLDEIPGDVAPGTVGVTVRQILPVFTAPRGLQPSAIEARVDSTDNVELFNPGRMRVRVLALRWYDAAGKMVSERVDPFYLLPGTRRSVALPKLPPYQKNEKRTLKAHTPEGERAIAIR